MLHDDMVVTNIVMQYYLWYIAMLYDDMGYNYNIVTQSYLWQIAMLYDDMVCDYYWVSMLSLVCNRVVVPSILYIGRFKACLCHSFVSISQVNAKRLCMLICSSFFGTI